MKNNQTASMPVNMLPEDVLLKLGSVAPELPEQCRIRSVPGPILGQLSVMGDYKCSGPTNGPEGMHDALIKKNGEPSWWRR